MCGRTNWVNHGKALLKCKYCGLVRAKLNYCQGKIEKLYQREYFFGLEYRDYLQDRTALEKNFKERIHYLTKNGYLKRDSKIIEIGCAYGYFLNLLNSKVKSAKGFDISKEAVKFAKNVLKVDATYDSFLNYQDKQVDLICMWDVIEHLLNPNDFIKKASETLKINGTIILTTGDIGSLVARLQGDRWRLIHPPTHIFYFDKVTICKMLKNNDFKIVNIRRTPIYRNVCSVIGQMGFNSISNLLSKIGFKDYSFGLNLFDILEVTAVKL